MFHQVLTPTYPLFREPQYLLSIANKVVEVARDFSLDIVHAHYAVPHATAAFLAKQVLASKLQSRAPRVVTTLHGTDITLVGNDPSYSEIVAFSIDQSDHVTAVSKSLRDSTYAELAVQSEIEVIPNFLDCGLHKRQHVPALRERFTDGDPNVKIVAHISNFRPVKHIDHVVAVFDRIRKRVPSRLLLVGDGPELPAALRTARELGMSQLVHAVGAQEEVLPLLSVSDLFLLPSAEESFGLAALEAMACGVPVVASRVGGVPEVIEHGKSGYLHPSGALDEMAASAVMLLSDAALHKATGEAARCRVTDAFCADKIVPLYEAAYKRLLPT
jgi:N-acetyl-alpha-D-glucosaminyl L-malate synthase BshA